jgi:hypothetical protein
MINLELKVVMQIGQKYDVEIGYCLLRNVKKDESQRSKIVSGSQGCFTYDIKKCIQITITKK